MRNKMKKGMTTLQKQVVLVGAGAVMAAGSYADYATDVKLEFEGALTTLKADALAMFGDAVPFIISVVGVTVLLSLAIRYVRKMGS